MTDIPKLARIKQEDENMEKLHVAARKGQTDHIRRLLSMGVNPSIQNKFGCTALHLACKYGQMNAVRELAPISDLTQAWHGQRPLHLAVVANNAEVVRVLLEGAKEQGKASFEAFINECDDYETNEIDGLTKRVHGQNPLQWCIGLGDSHVDMMKILLAHGASPTAKDRDGETALMRAIELHNRTAFDLIIAAGKPKDGATAAPSASIATSSEALASASSNPAAPPATQSTTLRLDICDKAGRSNLHYALLGNEPEMAAVLLQLGHEATMEDQDKITPVILAMRAAFPGIMETVLERVDQFQVLSTPFHNGFQVLPERIEWLPFVQETDTAAKSETVKVFQRKLEAINKANAPPPTADGDKKRKKRGAGPQDKEMELAPSAPVRR